MGHDTCLFIEPVSHLWLPVDLSQLGGMGLWILLMAVVARQKNMCACVSAMWHAGGDIAGSI